MPFSGSMSAVDVRWFTFAAAYACGIDTTPGSTVSLISTRARQAPDSVEISVMSPLRNAWRSASSGWTSSVGSAGAARCERVVLPGSAAVDHHQSGPLPAAARATHR